MKAAILKKYAKGGTALAVKDIPIPSFSDDEVLIKVIAAAVNPLDNMIVRGEVKLIVTYRLPLVMGNELSGVDYVLDTLGDKELAHEFNILRDGGSLVSLRGLHNGDFAKRMGLPFFKRLAFGMAGKKYDKLAAKRGQRYHFIFVHEDGAGLQKNSKIFAEKRVQTSLDEVFALNDVNDAMRKVASGKSRGKTIIKVG